MTKINNIDEFTFLFESSKTNKNKDIKSNMFNDTLSKAIDQNKASKTQFSQKPNALSEIKADYMDIMSPVEMVTKRTNLLLEMLDLYSSNLENSKTSLKDIAPILESIKDSSSDLLKEVLDLSTKDKELKDIATQTAITAQTEYMKFKRGDYI